MDMTKLHPLHGPHLKTLKGRQSPHTPPLPPPPHLDLLIFEQLQQLLEQLLGHKLRSDCTPNCDELRGHRCRDNDGQRDGWRGYCAVDQRIQANGGGVPTQCRGNVFMCLRVVESGWWALCAHLFTHCDADVEVNVLAHGHAFLEDAAFHLIPGLQRGRCRVQRLGQGGETVFKKDEPAPEPASRLGAPPIHMNLEPIG